jgi:hypothetical protein
MATGTARCSARRSGPTRPSLAHAFRHPANMADKWRDNSRDNWGDGRTGPRQGRQLAKPLKGDLHDYVRVNDKYTQCSSRTRRTAATTFGVGEPDHVGLGAPHHELRVLRLLLGKLLKLRSQLFLGRHGLSLATVCPRVVASDIESPISRGLSPRFRGASRASRPSAALQAPLPAAKLARRARPPPSRWRRAPAVVDANVLPQPTRRFVW